MSAQTEANIDLIRVLEAEVQSLQERLDAAESLSRGAIGQDLRTALNAEIANMQLRLGTASSLLSSLRRAAVDPLLPPSDMERAGMVSRAANPEDPIHRAIHGLPEAAATSSKGAAPGKGPPVPPPVEPPPGLRQDHWRSRHLRS